MRRVVLVCAALALLAPLWLLGAWLRPAPGAEVAAEAGEALRAGRAGRAAQLYRKAVGSGADSADLWYDLGCALFRAGDLPRARAAFEAARLRAPRDPDVRANLGLTLERLKMADTARPAVPVSTGEAELAWALLGAGAVAFALLWRLRGDRRLILAAAACLSLALPFGALAASRLEDGEAAVVVAEGTRIHTGPGREFPAERALPPGTLVRLRGEADSWRRIAMPAGEGGYVRAEELEPVPVGNGRATLGG